MKLIFKILNKLHKAFPHHIPGMTDWVWEVAVKGNQELYRQAVAARYHALALEAIEKEEK